MERIPTVGVDLKGGFDVEGNALLLAQVDNAPLLPREAEDAAGPRP